MITIVEKECERCFAAFEVPYAKREQKFCSRECSARSSQMKQNRKRGLGNPQTIFDIPHQNTRKTIFKRLDVGCSRCGWKEGTCDLHHINGKKVENPNGHWNVSLLCPNCHRLFHEKKISRSDIKSLDEQIGNSWKSVYYG